MRGPQPAARRCIFSAGPEDSASGEGLEVGKSARRKRQARLLMTAPGGLQAAEIAQAANEFFGDRLVDVSVQEVGKDISMAEVQRLMRENSESSQYGWFGRLPNRRSRGTMGSR